MGNSASHYVDDAETTNDNGYMRTEGGKRVPIGRPEMIMSKRRRRNDYLIDNRPSIAENELRNAEVYVEEVLAQSDNKKRRAPNFVNWMKYIVKTGNIRAAILNSPLTVTSATEDTRARRLRTREPSVVEIDADTDDEIIVEHERKKSSESIVEISIANGDDHETTRASTSHTVPETITLRDSPTHDDDDITIIPSTSNTMPLRETTNNSTTMFSRWSRHSADPTRPWHQAAGNDTRAFSSASSRPKGIDMEEHERYRALLRLTSKTQLCKLPARKEEETGCEQTPTAPRIDIDTTISEWNGTKERVRKSADSVELLREKLESLGSDRAHRDALLRQEEERRERYQLVRLKRDAEFEERLKKAKEHLAGRLVLPLKLIDYDFVELSDVQKADVERAWDRNAPKDEILAEGFRIQIRRSDLLKLHGLDWLNDEIINFFFEMIVDRPNRPCAQRKEPLPKVFTFNTFLYTKVTDANFKYASSTVKRWTRNVDLFEKDIVLVPVHLGMHWCLAVIDMKQRLIKYYDSLGGSNDAGMKALLDYLAAEHMERKKKPLERDTWDIRTEEDIPRQLNGSDCGVFACKFADYAARRKPIDFTQENMSYFRRRIVAEIMQKHLIAQY